MSCFKLLSESSVPDIIFLLPVLSGIATNDKKLDQKALFSVLPGVSTDLIDLKKMNG